MTSPHQQLRLLLGKKVESVEPSQVVISPPVPFSVSTVDELVSVEFGVPLFSATDYVVKISGISPAGRDDVHSVLEYTFRTPATAIFFLDRGTPTDSIIRTELDGTNREVVFSAPGIDEFVVVGNALAVTTSAPDEASQGSTLQIVSLLEGGSVMVNESIVLPASGTIEMLQVAPGTAMLGFVFTSAEPVADRRFDRTMMLVDAAAGREVKPVLGLDGLPLSALTWTFMPEGTQALVQTGDQSVFLVAVPQAEAPIPLGQRSPLGRLSADGTTVVLRDAYGVKVLTLSDLSEVRLEPSPIDVVVPFIGDVHLLTSGARIQRSVVLDSAGGYSSMITVDDGTVAHELYETPNGTGAIIDYSVSPNEQFVAIEVVPVAAESVSDGYVVDARATTITTVIVEISTGALVRSFDGFAVQW